MSKQTGNKPLSRSLRIYQKIAIAFVVLACLLSLFVLYLSISAATIHIVPVPQAVTTTFSVDVVSEATMTGQLSGVVKQATFTQADTFFLPEEGATPVEAKASGTVTLINETANDQQLIATTRLLSEEGVLFRLDEGVIVPAQGQVTTTASADAPGLAGEIGPTQFTIPGLAVSLQESIYAVSTESMNGGVSYVRVLRQTDLDDAAAALEETMLEGAKATLATDVDAQTYDAVAYYVEEQTRTADAEVGAEVGSFNVALELNITAVYYPSETLAQYAQADLQSHISENYDLARVSDAGPQVEVQSVDSQNGTANLSIYLDGIAVISQGSDVLEKGRLVGRSATEVITILESSELIDSASVTFTPFWLKRVPSLEDHIDVIIDEATSN